MAEKKFFATKEQLEGDYQQLGSMLKMAEKYGVSKKLVMNYMNRYGIERKKRTAKQVDCKVAPLLDKGLPTSQIASAVGVSETTVRKSAIRQGKSVNDRYHKGEIITHNGYRMVKAPEGHPGADSKGYVREHRLVLESKLGRYLEQHEVAHHINHDKLDNRPENLEVMTLASHTSMHHLGKKGRGPDKAPRKNSKQQ